MKYKNIFQKTVLSIFGLAALGAGCTSTQNGFMARQWSGMLREQQVTPIYPPREDIRVGDVFLTMLPPPKYDKITKESDFLEIPVLFANMNLESALESYYSVRPSYPLTPTNGFASNDTQFYLLPAAVEAVDEHIYKSMNPDRLRHVAFPDYSIAKIDQGSLQAVIPIEALNVAFGGNYGRAKEGSLKLSSCESVSLPLSKLLPALQNGFLGKHNNDFLVVAPYSGYLNALMGTNRQCYLTVLTEVFYARGIDVIVSSKKAASGVAGVNPANPTTAINLANSAAEISEALSKLNKELMTQSTPGGSVSVTSVSSQGIGLRRTFTRPIAVGVRSFTMTIARSRDDLILDGITHNNVGPLINAPLK